MRNILIIGASGHAKTVADIVEAEGKYKIVGFIDSFRQLGESILGYRVLGTEEDLPRLSQVYSVYGGIVGIGDNFVRSEIVNKLHGIDLNFNFVSACHPSAVISKHAILEAGTVIMAGAVVNPCCWVGHHCILNTNSSLDHDSVMGNFSSFSPRVTTGGNVKIGSFSAIGIGATISHSISVGEHTVIGAGATVLHNIPAGKVAYGTPARVVRDRHPGEKYLTPKALINSSS